MVGDIRAQDVVQRPPRLRVHADAPRLPALPGAPGQHHALVEVEPQLAYDTKSGFALLIFPPGSLPEVVRVYVASFGLCLVHDDVQHRLGKAAMFIYVEVSGNRRRA